VRRLKEAKCDVCLQTSSIAAARAALASGVDIIIIQGSEVGGHNRSTTGLFTLLPRMVDAVNPLPAVAAAGLRMNEEWQPRYAWARPACAWEPAWLPPSKQTQMTSTRVALCKQQRRTLRGLASPARVAGRSNARDTEPRST
jgi:hypothetical protein